ncbi:MAG: hypothetical protein WC865_14640 [Bacteroidales bacterium]
MDFVIDLGIEPKFLTNGVPIQVFFDGLEVPNLIRVAITILKPPDAGCLAPGDSRIDGNGGSHEKLGCLLKNGVESRYVDGMHLPAIPVKIMLGDYKFNPNVQL